MSTGDESRELLTRFLEDVWNRGNVEASDKYIAPKHTIHHDPGDPWDGQELDLAGYKERVSLSRAPFPATGNEIRMSGATVYCVDGGRLTGHWQITDRLGVYRRPKCENQPWTTFGRWPLTTDSGCRRRTPKGIWAG